MTDPTPPVRSQPAPWPAFLITALAANVLSISRKQGFELSAMPGPTDPTHRGQPAAETAAEESFKIH
jgi:hypothetical protein